ncbi:hypothetical protein ACTXT7_014799 [Hymenolepis weldensis]
MRRRRCNIQQLNSNHSSFSVFSHEYKDVNGRSPHGVLAERANGLQAHENHAKELREREMDHDLRSWVHSPLSPSLPSSSPRELLKHRGVLTAPSSPHPPFDVSKKSLQNEESSGTAVAKEESGNDFWGLFFSSQCSEHEMQA